MSRITLSDLNENTPLTSDEQKAVRGGFFGWSPLYWMPQYQPYSRYANGYGGFTNQFQRGTFGYGIQAATFAGQALGDQRHASFLANF
jgi:hypothetical protein